MDLFLLPFSTGNSRPEALGTCTRIHSMLGRLTITMYVCMYVCTFWATRCVRLPFPEVVVSSSVLTSRDPSGGTRKHGSHTCVVQSLLYLSLRYLDIWVECTLHSSEIRLTVVLLRAMFWGIYRDIEYIRHLPTVFQTIRLNIASITWAC